MDEGGWGTPSLLFPLQTSYEEKLISGFCVISFEVLQKDLVMPESSIHLRSSGAAVAIGVIGSVGGLCWSPWVDRGWIW